MQKFCQDYPFLLEDIFTPPQLKIFFLERLRAFLGSKTFMVFALFLATLFYTFEQEVFGIVTMILLISIMLIFISDIMPAYLPIMLATMAVLRMYDSFNVFINYAWVIGIALLSVIFHIIFNRPKAVVNKNKLGELTLPLIGVSLALILGGIGSITTAEYFNYTALYYVLGLGVGMLIAYQIFLRRINPSRAYNTKEYLAFAMFIVGTFAALMVFIQYATNAVPALLGPPFSYNIIEQYFVISNNISTIILMVMPFSFYLAIRKKHGIIYFASGILQGFAMLISTSRSGFFFAFALTLPLALYTIIKDKQKRIQYFVCIAILLSAAAAVFAIGYEKIWIPMFTNYAFNMQDDFKMYLLLSVAFILFVTFFSALYKLKGRPLKIVFSLTLVAFILISIGVFVFWDKALSLLVRMDYNRGMMADLAVKNFYKYPIFGTGLGYSGTRIYYVPKTATLGFYHSAPFQILGLGVVGILAYGYMLFSRIRILRKTKDSFNYTVYLCLIGLYMMSLVNPGVFVPLMFMLQFNLYFAIVEQNNNQYTQLNNN